MSAPSRSEARARRSPAAWAALALLLAALLIAALSFDPRRWPSVVGDEATYLMAAQSLAWDGDLQYSVADLERFRRLLEREPDGLILQRRVLADGAGGEVLRYAKPVFYPLAIAPFVRVLPRRGAAAANAVILILASVCTALALEHRVGRVAPLWVACLVFASVTFAHAFWAHADLMLMSLVAVSLSLVELVRARSKGRREDAATHAVVRERSAGRSSSVAPPRRPGIFATLRSGWRRFARGESALVVAGALAGVVSISRPVYLVVAFPLLVAAGSRARMLRVALGLGVVLALSLLGNLLVRGTWSSYSGERHGYYAYTGFPLEAGAGGAVSVEGAVRPSASWTERLVPFGLDLRVSAWNLLYLLVGRHVGLLPYFLPLLLGFVAWRSSVSSWALLGAFAAVAVAFLILRPYNFWGGGGALANRYLLPVYPCLWFLAQRRRGALPVVVVTVLAAPFLWPTWTSPRSFFRGEDGNYRHVSTVARHLLPYETTQNQLKPSGHDDFVHRAIDETEEGVHGGGLWIKPLSPGLRRAGDEQIELTVGAAETGLLVGSPRPIAGLELLIGDDAADGATLPVELGWRRAHPMWWTKEAYFLYPVDVEAALQRSPVSYAPGQTVSFRLAVIGPGGDG